MPKQITLNVDVARNATLVDHVFTQVRAEPDKTTYNGPNATLSTRDDLTFQRTYPKRAGNSQGIAEAYLKFARNVSVPGVDSSTSVEHLATLEMRIRIPVGLSDAEIIVMLQRVAALLNEPAVVDSLTQDLIIDQEQA